MTPNELYNRIPEDSYYGCNYLIGCYNSHVPELEAFEWDLDQDKAQKDERIMIKVYKHFDFDHRRFWRLSSVWFDGAPVMVLQNAGREGDDCSQRFVTDEERYRRMVAYLFTLIKHDDSIATVDPDKDIKDLTSFYGNELDGHFERYTW